MKTQYITDKSGNKLAVILPMKEYQRMTELLDELEDIQLYDKAKQEDDGVRIPIEEAFAQLDQERKSAQ